MTIRHETIEAVRERAYIDAGSDGVLEFFDAALAIGCSELDAERITETLNLRTMRARGAV